MHVIECGCGWVVVGGCGVVVALVFGLGCLSLKSLESFESVACFVCVCVFVWFFRM